MRKQLSVKALFAQTMLILLCVQILCGCQSLQRKDQAEEAQLESEDPDRPSPPVPNSAALLLGDFGNVELAITANRDGLIQKVEISRPSKAKFLDEPTRAWVETHWKMPPAQPNEPDSRKFIAPIVFPKGRFPVGGHFPPPSYPSELMRARVEGLVVLQIVIDESGSVESATVLLSTGSKALGEHTRAHVLKHWKFPPGRNIVLWPCEFRIRYGF